MNVVEFLLRVLSALRPMLPGLLAAGLATLLALIVLFFLCRNAWLPDSRFRLAGLFFGLDRRGRIRLACAWVKLIFSLVFVVGFQRLLLQYLMFLLPGALLALSDAGLQKKASSLFWLTLQTVGLLSTNLICGYIQEMGMDVGFFLVYMAMGLFLILFSAYLFLNELAAISIQRDVDARRIWGGEDEGESAE